MARQFAAAVVVAALSAPRAAEARCAANGVFADMSDGDLKSVVIAGGKMTITPHGNNQTWEIHADVETMGCSAAVNFSSDPRKPNPPPCALTVTLYEETDAMGKNKLIFEYTDPSDACKFGQPGSPLNTWVQVPAGAAGETSFSCPTKLDAVYGDMSDGDFKRVVVDGTEMTITPSGNDQKWAISATVDPKTCSAVVDFASDPRKPNPPPCKLVATLWEEKSVAGFSKSKENWEYTDPTDACKFGEPGSPLNTWVRYP